MNSRFINKTFIIDDEIRDVALINVNFQLGDIAHYLIERNDVIETESASIKSIFYSEEIEDAIFGGEITKKLSYSLNSDVGIKHYDELFCTAEEAITHYQSVTTEENQRLKQTSLL